jgi:thermitase
MPVKVMGADGTGSYSAIASGITWAVDHGARVLSLSLSGTSDSATLHNAVTYAHNKGAVIAAAAGNSSCNCTSYPAAYAEVLGVAATGSTDALEAYSNYGSWVKVAAPGTNYTTTYTGGYASYAGTSSATPVVAGVAGLALSTGATGAATESAITRSAAKVGSFVSYGRVDAAATLAALGSAAPAPAPTTSPSPSPSPTASPTTTTFSGTFTNKSTTQSWSQSLKSGTVSATLTFSKASSMTLTLTRNGQTVATAQGGSPRTLTASVSDGTYTWVVSGPARSSYGLTVPQ